MSKRRLSSRTTVHTRYLHLHIIHCRSLGSERPLRHIVRLLYFQHWTTAQSNLTKRSHRHRTWTVQSHSPGGANMHRHLIHGNLCMPTRVHIPKDINRFSGFCWLTIVTDRQTDHATRSVTIGRIYVRSAAMRPNNKPNRLATVEAIAPTRLSLMWSQHVATRIVVDSDAGSRVICRDRLRICQESTPNCAVRVGV